MVTGRGAHEEIDVVPGFPLDNKLSGNVVDLCPVGALCDKDFLYRQRVWFMRRHAGVCTGCATGCSIWIEENQDRVYRIKPRENPQVNQWWICNDGRYDYPHVHDDRRLAAAAAPRRSGARSTSTGRACPRELDGAAPQRPADWRPCSRRTLTVEEAYLLAKFVRGIDPEAVLASGPGAGRRRGRAVPRRFHDLRPRSAPTAAASRRSSPTSPAGVADVRRVRCAELAARAESRGVWVSGGYTDATGSTRRRPGRFAAAASCWSSRTCSLRRFRQRATYVLPGGGLRRARRLLRQSARSAAIGPLGDPPAGRRAARGEPVLGAARAARACTTPARCLSEIAAEILYFHAAGGPMPEMGIELEGEPAGGTRGPDRRERL